MFRDAMVLISEQVEEEIEEIEEIEQKKPVEKFMTMSLLSLLDKDSQTYTYLKDHPLLRDAVKNKMNGSQFLICESKDGKNIFNVDKAKLISIITMLAAHALFTLNQNRFIQQTESGEKILKVDCLQEFLLLAIHKFDLEIGNFTTQNLKGSTKEASCVRLVSFIISLRITIEIRAANIKLKEVSLEDAQKDWEAVTRYKSDKTSIENLSMMDARGKKAADLYTLPQRNKAAAVASRFKSTVEGNSPYDILCGESPNTLASLIRRLVKQVYIDELSKSASDFNLEMRQIYKRINKDYQVGQFPPILVHDVIATLKKMYGFSFPTATGGKPAGAMLDPCAGWGGRLIGALSHPDIATYTGVDPNLSLTDSYAKIHRNYAPDKRVTIFPKKIEDVTKDDLQLAGHQEYQLCMTSPPYAGVEHYYKGQTFYGDDKNLNQLFHGLVKTADVLSYGGFLVINFGVVGPVKKPKKHLPKLFFNYIESHPTATTSQLELFPIVGLKSKVKGSVGGFSGKEFFIYARRVANMGPIPLPVMATPTLLTDDACEYEVMEEGTLEPLKRPLTDIGAIEESDRSAKRPRKDDLFVANPFFLFALKPSVNPDKMEIVPEIPEIKEHNR